MTSKLSKECIILLGYLSDHLASSSDRSLQFDIEGIDMHVEELIHGLIQQEHTAMKQANHEEWCKSVSDLKRLLDRWVLALCVSMFVLFDRDSTGHSLS